MLTGVEGARSADWSFETFTRQRVTYDDNIGLNRQDVVSDLSSQSTLEVDLGRKSQSHRFGLSSRFDYTTFLEERDLDSDDQRVAVYGDYQGALMSWGLTAAYSRDTTRTRDEDDTGQFILENLRRHEVEVKPSWSLLVSQVDRIALRAEFDSVQFEEQLIDFWRLSGELAWTRKLSQSDEVEVSAFASLIEPDDDLDRQTQAYGLKAGWSTMPLRGLEVRLGAGVYWARTAFDPSSDQAGSFGDQTSLGALPSLGISYQIDPESRFSAAYARSIRPSGGGAVLERDRLEASFERAWSPRGSWRIDFRYQSQSDLEDGGNDRDLITIAPSVAWQLTESWALRGAYRFRWQSLDGNGEDALSNAVFMTMTYEPWTYQP